MPIAINLLVCSRLCSHNGSGSEFFESGSEEESCNPLSSDEEQSVEMIEHMLVGAATSATLHMEVAMLET